MVDVVALQTAYNDAVAKGNNKLANELLALWRDALKDRTPNRTPKRSLSTVR
jgi:hypothetical protein